MTETDQRNARIIKICFQFLAFAVVAMAFRFARDILLPVTIALLAYMLLLPLVNLMRKAGMGNLVIVIVCLLLLVVVVAFLGFFATISIQQLINKFPAYEARFKALNQSLDVFLAEVVKDEDLLSFLQSFEIPWFDLISSALGRASSQVVRIGKAVMMIFLFDFFLLLESNTLENKFLAFSRNSASDTKMRQFLEKTNSQLSRFVGRKALICLLTGISYFIIGEVSNLDMSLACAVLAMLFNFIPAIGPVLSVCIASMFGLLQSFPNWGRFFMMLFLCIGVEILFVSLIGRKAKKSYLNLSPAFILISLVFGGYIWGLPGMFIAVPLMSLIQMILANLEPYQRYAVLMSDLRK